MTNPISMKESLEDYDAQVVSDSGVERDAGSSGMGPARTKRYAGRRDAARRQHRGQAVGNQQCGSGCLAEQLRSAGGTTSNTVSVSGGLLKQRRGRSRKIDSAVRTRGHVQLH